MQLLPLSIGSMDQVDWIPVDLMAKITVELALPPAGSEKHAQVGSRKSRMRVFHGVNPKTTHWRSLVPVIARHFGPSVRLVPWPEWLDELRATYKGAASGGAKETTGFKLMEFFGSLGNATRPGLATAITEESSPTLRTLDPVHSEWMELWLGQWRF